MRLMRLPGGRHLCIVVVFVLALVAWVFFRAPTFGQAIHVTSLMFNFGRWDWAAARELVWTRQMFLVALMAARHLYFHGRNARAVAGPAAADTTWIPWALQPAMAGLLVVACVVFRGPGSAFIYFQF
jgi:alginate O-acetyltransferase complex protein AlgI